ncbi:formate/nitrite transporter family protein [Ruminococcus sp. XPD3002]|uniref:formate/nitrite transporter family protein n=1 Tax=Ruminococcus sp. XPD3002 TaxID=1452269 RepID=UPI0009177648|nr:Formate/nitrite transporter FocA, FNT family [Ruminococcus flavefaciens]
MRSESFISILAKAVLSGLMIGVGGIVYLMVDNKYIGGFMFSFGLFTIIQCGFALYTGKVGYIPENKPKYLREVAITLLGNVIGTGGAALLVRLTRIGAKVHENASACMEVKMGDSVLSQLVMGVFCGLLMYLAVDNGKRCKKCKSDMSYVFGTVIPVMLFIFCGFNHSVADCFYMFAADASVEGALYILIVAIGNACGGMLIPLVKKLFDENTERAV